jgi:hypothetical protein
VPAADLKDGMTPKGFIALQVHDVGDKTEPLEIRWCNIRPQAADQWSSRRPAPRSRRCTAARIP